MTRWAAVVARWWTRLYTAPLPPRLRDERRAEVDSDLWECLADPVAARQILPRLVLGALDDVTWSVGHMDRTHPASTWWATGVAATISLVWLSIAFGPASGVVQESRWLFPTAATVHLLGMVAFIGPRLVVDLRLLGWALGGVPARELAGRLTPWIAVGALVTVASGLTMLAGEVARVFGNPIFVIKIVAVVAALANIGISHLVLGRAGGREPSSVARLSGVISIVLAIVIIVAGSLTPYVG